MTERSSETNSQLPGESVDTEPSSIDECQSIPQQPADSSASDPPSRLQDALEVWDAETESEVRPDLSLIRLDASETILIPFTTGMATVELHYLRYADLGYAHCNGADCLACRLGNQRNMRYLLPVYDPIDRLVGVLPISPSLRPRALKPQLRPVLERLKSGNERPVIAVRRDGMQFAVACFPLQEGTEDGAAEIAAFLEALGAGRIDLTQVYPRVPDAELAGIPEISAAMRLRGIAQ